MAGADVNFVKEHQEAEKQQANAQTLDEKKRADERVKLFAGHARRAGVKKAAYERALLVLRNQKDRRG